jgi:hypothetical protein
VIPPNVCRSPHSGCQRYSTFTHRGRPMCGFLLTRDVRGTRHSRIGPSRSCFCGMAHTRCSTWLTLGAVHMFCTFRELSHKTTMSTPRPCHHEHPWSENPSRDMSLLGFSDQGCSWSSFSTLRCSNHGRLVFHLVLKADVCRFLTGAQASDIP